MEQICNSTGNEVYINYNIFKESILDEKEYVTFTQTIVKSMAKALKNNLTFVLHLNMETFTLLDLEKYMRYFKQLAQTLQMLFPNKLEKGYVYNAPSFIKAAYAGFFKLFMDSVTQKKIIIVE